MVFSSPPGGLYLGLGLAGGCLLLLAMGAVLWVHRRRSPSSSKGLKGGIELNSLLPEPPQHVLKVEKKKNLIKKIKFKNVLKVGTQNYKKKERISKIKNVLKVDFCPKL